MQKDSLKKTIKLKFADCEEPVEFDENLVKFSPLLNRALEGNNLDEVIDLSQIKSNVFKVSSINVWIKS